MATFGIILNKYPPSANKLYFVHMGRKVLSSDGRAYKNYVHAQVAANIFELGKLIILKEGRIGIFYKFYQPTWENKGWPKTAKTRYKRVDIANMQKCLDDAITESLGIDDSLIFRFGGEKCLGPARVVVAIENYSPHITPQS